ncbi:type 4a pilus biogenesis protein PilO [Candidatus Microgenomates bacterium]|nr:type 4a pilus biogenesis protein PilO [Candidatus Microgenomates bacterium]
MKPKQLYIFLLSLFAAVIAAGLIGYGLGHRLLASKISSLKKLSGDITLESEHIDNLQRLQADYQKIQPLADKAQSVLPAQKQQAEVIAQIGTIVKNNGLELAGLTFESTQGLPDEKSQSKPATIGGILVMPVRFQTTSSYSQLQSLLASFEKEQRFMRVSNLEITRNDNQSLTTNFTLEVFFKP